MAWGIELAAKVRGSTDMLVSVLGLSPLLGLVVLAPASNAVDKTRRFLAINKSTFQV